MKKYRLLGALLAGAMAVTGVPAVTQPLIASVSAAEKLAAPTGVKAKALSDSEIKIIWKPVEGAYAYRIYERPEWSDDYTKCGYTETADYTVSILAEGRSYSFKVTALTLDGGHIVESPMSAAVSAVTKYSAPNGVKAESTGLTTVKVTWNAHYAAARYRVYLAAEADGRFRKYKDVTGTSCKIKGLEKGGRYLIKVAVLTAKDGKYIVHTPSGMQSVYMNVASYKGLPSLPAFGNKMNKVCKKLGLTDNNSDIEYKGTDSERRKYNVILNGTPDNGVTLIYDQSNVFYAYWLYISENAMKLKELLSLLGTSDGEFVRYDDEEDGMTTYFRETDKVIEVISTENGRPGYYYCRYSKKYMPESQKERLRHDLDSMLGKYEPAFDGLPVFPAFGKKPADVLKSLGLDSSRAEYYTEDDGMGGTKYMFDITINGHSGCETALYFSKDDRFYGYDVAIGSSVMTFDEADISFSAGKKPKSAYYKSSRVRYIGTDETVEMIQALENGWTSYMGVSLKYAPAEMESRIKEWESTLTSKPA